uniref:Uncharacterized protein n=1 Tax=Poecilia mexicana TaxID=48701 RepID=A0A3B3X713_9TELE
MFVWLALSDVAISFMCYECTRFRYLPKILTVRLTVLLLHNYVLFVALFHQTPVSFVYNRTKPS